MQAFFADAFISSYSITPGKTILVGVSGGADSICLLHLLHRSGCSLVAAHFNHQLRPTAGRDAEYAAALADQLGIPFTLGTGDVKGYAQEQGLSLETAARQLRYKFLFAEATRCTAQAVAVAHHADDQAETILLHLLRGAGYGGLQGMAQRFLPNPWSKSIPLIRPLLSFWKKDILAYCAENELNYCDDETNLNEDYRRNSIRHTLIPQLEGYNPQIRQALWRLSQIARDEQEVMLAAADEVWKACVREISAHSVNLDAAAFRDLSPALQRLVLRRALAQLRPGLSDVGFEAVERGRQATLNSQTGAQVDLVGGLRLQNFGVTARLVAWEGIPEADWPQLAQVCPVPDLFPVRIGRNWEFQMQPIVVTAAIRQAISDNSDLFQAWVDPGAIHGALTLRSRWPGARFQPFGMAAGSQKVSDLMINHKIPRPARAAWPLLCMGEEIIWVPGITLAHSVQVTGSTREALYLTLKMTASDQNES